MDIKLRNIMYIILIIFVLAFFIFQNSNLATTTIKYTSNALPRSFEGFTIVQISDLHSKRFGKKQKTLLRQIKRANPDIIVVTGDLIDRRRYDLESAMVFIKGAVKIAPVYYVSGNHEAWSLDYEEIKGQLLKQGVIVLDNDKAHLEVGGDKIEIIGLKDPAFETPEGVNEINLNSFKEHLKVLSGKDNFQILLSHRPELFDLYVKNNIDLTFSGHAHGGQFRLPIIGGLFAPDQGVFPKYTSGKHQKGESTLIVSRGLGNSIFPIRIFNNPEIIKVVLEREIINEK